MTTRRPELRFTSNQELIDRFNKVAALEFEDDKNACFEAALSALEEVELLRTKLTGFSTDLDLTEAEMADVELASSKSHMPIKQLRKIGLMAEVKRTLKQHGNTDLSALSDSDLKEKTVRGTAAMRIQKAIDAIAKHNDSCQEREDKVFISESMVFSATGSNRKAITDYFSSHADEIQGLNDKHQLDASVNRKGKNTGFNIKAVLGL
jgi:hypothetical protein